MKTKIHITETMRSFNDAVELADYLTDFKFDQEPADKLLSGLLAEVDNPISSVSVEYLKNAIVGISIKR